VVESILDEKKGASKKKVDGEIIDEPGDDMEEEEVEESESEEEEGENATEEIEMSAEKSEERKGINKDKIEGKKAIKVDIDSSISKITL
jgi:hypothetical protein